MDKKKIAIIGSGATAIYLLKHINDHLELLTSMFNEISIFEKGVNMGMGMPYNPETTDKYNLANISSEELPELPETFGDWLRKQDAETLESLNVKDLPIDDSAVYSRISLGSYFQDQYHSLIHQLTKKGITVHQINSEEVRDIIYNEKTGNVLLKTSKASEKKFDKVIIATGHHWFEDDNEKNGYYASPWPIHKLLPAPGEYYNHAIGTLGASLSAFDVVSSLAHRHGSFMQKGEELNFELHAKAKGFKIVMHSFEGWLPHLQYEQKYAIREIYRHTSREEMLDLIDADGFLRIHSFFDKIGRPALIQAFRKDRMEHMVEKLEQEKINFKEFIKLMSEDHEYSDSFEGMRKERIEARNSVNQNKPIHWKETLDDLMYCLNFHAELLPAEDHLFLRKEVMSFLMNVIAALPLSSANILLALYDADCIELIAGKVEILEDQDKPEQTAIQVEKEDGTLESFNYKMFVNCAGQKNLELEQFPFPSLIKDGNVRKARAKFETISELKKLPKNVDKDSILEEKNELLLFTGGVDIDAAYRLIDSSGNPNDNIYDISFTHTSGCRPYSYGLQACSATSKILAEVWLAALSKNEIDVAVEKMTELYEDNEI
ncbi:FAD-NAD(P)-binding protein [Gillisia mitskevichiae]|uniref:FAD-NAD(P)-binding protein n=1 Tax=Gillisia mitskevichiae TaxID=270921 RepID=A0A495PU74_9FLAO|nr:FAD/NAD(P)-binding protein [Gillisia mitskevichiae]RKS53767.1 FAD-NAD(P)-binding protein [Gillisia mitskevichiae]